MSTVITKERSQAFIEDIAAVYAKHGLRLGSQEEIFPVDLDPDSRFLYLDHYGDLQTGEDDPRAQLLEWYEVVEDSRKTWPVAPIPTSAHGRLAAAARIATIRTEQEAPVVEFDPELIEAEPSTMQGCVVLRHPLPGGGFVESDALPWSYVPGISQGRTNPIGYAARTRQLRARFDEAVGGRVPA